MDVQCSQKLKNRHATEEKQHVDGELREIRPTDPCQAWHQHWFKQLWQLYSGQIPRYGRRRESAQDLR